MYTQLVPLLHRIVCQFPPPTTTMNTYATQGQYTVLGQEAADPTTKTTINPIIFPPNSLIFFFIFLSHTSTSSIRHVHVSMHLREAQLLISSELMIFGATFFVCARISKVFENYHFGMRYSQSTFRLRIVQFAIFTRPELSAETGVIADSILTHGSVETRIAGAFVVRIYFTINARRSWRHKMQVHE